MAVLMLQSLYTLFFPGWDSQLSGSIDVVVRTSAAAVFGYFLSANFAARDEESPQVPLASPVHRIEPAEAAISSSAGPVNQIGLSPAHKQIPERSSFRAIPCSRSSLDAAALRRFWSPPVSGFSVW